MADNPQDVPQGPFIPISAMSDLVPMLNDPTKVVTSHAAYTADIDVLSLAQSYTDSKIPKTYVNGVLKTNRRLRWIDRSSVAGGAGNATFYLTSDLTSGGTARATAIDLDSVSVRTEDNANQYAFGLVTSPNVKTIVVNVFRQIFSGVVVLTLTVLGSVVNSAAPNGTVVVLQADCDAA